MKAGIPRYIRRNAVCLRNLADRRHPAHGLQTKDPVLVGQWKKEFLERAGALFETKRGPKPAEDKSDGDRLYGEIGG